MSWIEAYLEYHGVEERETETVATEAGPFKIYVEKEM